MNNFTKEELENIFQSLWRTRTNIVTCHNEKMISTGDMQLINKIQSMIDNYCGHEGDND